MKAFDVEIYGMSRSECIGIKVGNFPKGISFSMSKIQEFVDRRKSVDCPWSTLRMEEDKVILVSGADKEDTDRYITNGKELHFKINNMDVKPDNLTFKENPVCRPSHADYTSYVRYGGVFPGGGMFSGRMMAVYAILGSVCYQFLQDKGIKIDAYMSKIGGVDAMSYKDKDFSLSKLHFKDNIFRVLDEEKNKNKLIEEIIKAKDDSDSVGGIIECVCQNPPLGLGGALFENIESRLAHYIFTIPAVKGLNFGIGDGFANLRGSEVKDELYLCNNKVLTKQNNNGGINGGITNGMPILFSVILKPTPSISKKMKTVQLGDLKEVELELKGRNDVCIVPRAVVLIESALAITLFEYML